MIIVLAATLLWIGHPQVVAASSCTGVGSYFAGNEEPLSSPAALGVSMNIEEFNHSLCGGTSDSFSSDWVALEGTHAYPGYNIFQIGFDKCKLGACGPSSPENTEYYFWAYGRNPGGSCGLGIGPVAMSFGNATAGSPFFKIQRESVPDYDYQAFKSGVFVRGQAKSDLEICWPGGVQDAALFTEVFDDGTQQGGSTSNKQDFTNVRYFTNTWYNLSRTLGHQCDVQQRVSGHCNTSSSSTNDYLMYDSRFP